MPSPRQFALLATGLLAASLLVAAVPVESRAPPRAACGVCTDALDATAAEHGVALERGDTALAIQVTPDASTRWTARVELTRGADALRDDALRAAVVADALERARTVADPANVTSRLDGSTLVVSYRDADAADRRAGVVLFTAFHASDPPPFAAGGEGSPYPGADVVVVRAPAGHAVSGDYGAASESATAVRWRGGNAGGGIDRHAVVAFVPDGAWAPWVRATVARLLVGL